MEDTGSLIESLLEKATDYSKTSYELFKLKSIDKTADFVTSFVPYSVVFVFIIFFLLFLNTALAFLLGNILNSMGLGFFIVAVFNGILGIIILFLLQKSIKNSVRNYINKQLLKQNYI